MFPEWRPELLRYLVGGGFRDDSTLGFQLAHSAVIMSDGSIFLASYRPPFVRYSAARGNVAHLGVTGEGPGEYRQIQWIARFRGDSLRIWDGILRRLATLDPEGRVVAEARPSPKLRDALEFWPSRLFDDGRLLAIGRRGVPEAAGNLIIRGDLLLVDSSNSVVESLAKDVPLGEMHLKEAPNQPGMDRSYSVVTPPFTRYGLTAAGGQRWCYTWTAGVPKGNKLFRCVTHSRRGSLMIRRWFGTLMSLGCSKARAISERQESSAGSNTGPMTSCRDGLGW
jgi:hypothetical protein